MISEIKTALVVGALLSAYFYGRHTISQEYQIDRLESERDQAALLATQYADAIRTQEVLSSELEKARANVRVIREQVKVYVQPEKDHLCGPSVGVIGLFNAARRPDLPANSPATVEEGRTPSGYSTADFNDQNLDVIGRYNALMTEHNKLVELLTNANTK